MTNLDKFKSLAEEFNLTIIPDDFVTVWTDPEEKWATYGMYDKNSLNRVLLYNTKHHTIQMPTTAFCTPNGTMIFVNFRKFSTYAEMKENLKQVIEQWKKAQIDRKKKELENDFKQ